MSRVKNVMQRLLVTASPVESVRLAAQRMDSLQIECLPVMSDRGELIGLLTLWDVGRAHPNRLVADAMTQGFSTIAASACVWDARKLAEERAAYYLPVLDGDKLVGIVSRADLEVAVAHLTDAMTGLPGVAYLCYQVERLWEEAREVCLIFLDLDQFGLLNKRLGHAVGDGALQRVARIMAQKLDRQRDFLCRYGGDEFAVATTRSTTEAAQLASSLVREISALTLPDGTALTGSAGVAGGRRRSVRQWDAEMVENLINVASRASTEAKRNASGVLMIDYVFGA